MLSQTLTSSAIYETGNLSKWYKHPEVFYGTVRTLAYSAKAAETVRSLSIHLLFKLNFFSFMSVICLLRE